MPNNLDKRSDPPFCDIHQKPMAVSKFGGWYCTARDPESGNYCTSRVRPYPKQKPNAVNQEAVKKMFAVEVFRRFDKIEEQLKTITELLNKELM